MKELLMAQAGLGIDIATRNVYILDETGNVLASSNQETTRLHDGEFADRDERRGRAGGLDHEFLYGFSGPDRID